MTDKHLLGIRITKEQRQILEAKANSCGFVQLSDYVRYVLFVQKSFLEKIDQIHKKVVENAEEQNQ